MNAPFNRLTPQDGVSRREVMVVGAALVGGALVVGCSPAELMSAGSKVEVGSFGPFIRFDPDGAVTVLSKHIEFGQGNHAGLAAIVAEELDADWNRVKVLGSFRVGLSGGVTLAASASSSPKPALLPLGWPTTLSLTVISPAGTLHLVAAACTNIARAPAPALRSWSQELEIADEPPVS